MLVKKSMHAVLKKKKKKNQQQSVFPKTKSVERLFCELSRVMRVFFSGMFNYGLSTTTGNENRTIHIWIPQQVSKEI